MNIDLNPVFGITGKKMDIDYTIKAEDVDEYPRVSDVKVFGSVQNKTDIVTLTITCSYELTCLCDRCAEEITRHIDQKIEHELIKNLEDEQDISYIEVPDGNLDLDELIREDIILNLPYLFLCKEDCKGLCVQCGANLNDGECKCKSPTDPRLSALLDLLD
ncbi:MAG TPA: DUF177 domain-containing protein [Clostridiales bacterium]|nr:DUF177 domain-containing protein [Clostridiales bacterium]